MAIPETQLDTWSHQGSIVQSSSTYGIVKNALEAKSTSYTAKNFEVFLQGSYGNDANIYAESDVDVVIRMDSIFYHDLEGLSAQEQAAFKAAHSNSSYSYDTYKADVVAALKGSFGADVEAGPKAVKIKAGGSRRNADVIVAAQFRRYHRFSSVGDEQYDKGICFYSGSNEKIVNYPKRHSVNCTTKHQGSGLGFKPMVRIWKNMRTRLVQNGAIKTSTAPSYFIEGLLYNVPNDNFGKTYEDTFVSAFNWILNADRTQFVCANEQYYLLRETSVTWPPANCDLFLSELAKLWKNWK